MAEGEKVLTSLADVQVGMRLEAMDKYGKWYIAKVIEVDEDGGDVLVHFEGWSSRYDEYVEVKEGRLRTLTSKKLAALLKEKKAKKNLNIGDRVQAKWEDGRMYFGKIVSVRGGDVEVLFDDGVYYTAPFSSVRKRNMDKAQDVMEDYLREPPLAAAMEARKRRAEKRQRNDDSTSQTSLSSPPSSPVFMPKKVKPSRIDDDSTETESDVDDGRRIRIRERPFSKQTQSSVVTDSPTVATSSKGGSKSSSPASSDSEQSRRSSRKYEALREPYKLRGVTQMSRLSPVDEDPTARSLTGSGSGSGLGSAFLTPPFESQAVVKSSQMLLLSSSPSPRPSLGSTPPETPELSSRSQRLRKNASALAAGSSAEDSSSHGVESSKRIVTDSAAPTPSKQTRGESPLASKKQLSPSASSSSVATRTRAQTKFEHVVKKSEKPAKLAPKELVIMWDHNEHKCKFTGCGKSFRKETLLHSHIKHYHHIKTKTPAAAKAKGAAGTTVKPGGKSQSPLSSPKSPQMSPKTPNKSSPKPHSPKSRALRSPKSRMLRSPKSPSLKSILSPPKRKVGDSSAKSDPLRRSKSPTESFFESMEKQHRSVEVMKLLEQSAKEQAAALSRKSPPAPLQSQPSSSLKKQGIIASPTALKFQLPESSVTSSGKMTARAPEYASPRPTILQIQHSKPKASGSSSKPSTSGSKKMKQVVVRALSPLSPHKFPLVEIKALPKDSLPLSPTKKQQSHGKASHSQAVQSQKAGGRAASTSKETGASLLDDGVDLVDEGEGGGVEDARSPSMGSEGNEDDVVHCVCGSEVDEGFMIQCEQCLCWQHGDCIDITKETLPEKYICYICTNPPGLRTRLKHRFDRDWFAEGSLPSFPGGPKFSETTAVRLSHRLADSLFKLRKMVHSTKVKLQAASNPNHPYLKQWAKECAHLSQEDIMSYLIAALQPVSYEPGDTQEASGLTSTSSPPVALRTDGCESSTDVEGSQEPRNRSVCKTENISREGTDSDTTAPFRKLSSPINVAALHLDPLPPDTKSRSVTPTPPPPPSSSSFPSYSSLTTTAESSSLDPKSLKLAPLPPLSVEDLHSVTGVILESPLQQSTPTVTPGATPQTSVPTLTSSALLETVHKPSISFSENPIPEHEKPIPDPEDLFDSNLEISEEFGVQEMSVFAVDGDSHPIEIESKPPQIEQDLTTPLAVVSSGTMTTTSVSLIPGSSKLISSSRSAFKPVIIPVTSSTAKSPLTSLLASQQTTSSRGGLTSPQSFSVSRSQTASFSVKPPTTFTDSTTALGSLGLHPKIERNPIFTPTLSSLSSVPSTMGTVTLGEFAEAFMHGDMTNWVHRMLLYDHIEAVQNKVMAWMDLVEKQLEEIPCDENSLKDMNALLTDVQSIVRQLGQVQRLAASESS